MIPRELHDHQINPKEPGLLVLATDTPGHGLAHHRYVIGRFDNRNNASKFTVDEPTDTTVILFQNGAIPEVGPNGVTHEALLAVVIDRLRSFQAGPFACRQNALALTKLEEGLMWLHARTHERINRNVEGTHVK